MGGRGSSGGGVLYSADGRKMTVSQFKNLQDNGAVLWQKYGKNRLYIENYIPDAMGLKMSYYKSGNISSATLNGEIISNSEAGRIAASAHGMYINLDNLKIISGDYAPRGQMIKDFIKKKLKWD